MFQTNVMMANVTQKIELLSSLFLLKIKIIWAMLSIFTSR